jgi:hypothetical protein
MSAKLLLLLIITVFAISGCQSTSETIPAPNNSTNRVAVPANSAANAVNAANTANLTANTAVNQAANMSAPQASTPTEIFKALGDAGNKKDVAALKQLFNRKSLEMFAGEAKSQSKSIDEVMVNQRAIVIAKTGPATRNEKITGDSATIEVKSASGSWEKMYFTREDGQWKVAMDKYMEEMIRQVEESTKNLEKSGDREGDK